jgi:hypothetical protein
MVCDALHVRYKHAIHLERALLLNLSGSRKASSSGPRGLSALCAGDSSNHPSCQSWGTGLALRFAFPRSANSRKCALLVDWPFALHLLSFCLSCRADTPSFCVCVCACVRACVCVCACVRALSVQAYNNDPPLRILGDGVTLGNADNHDAWALMMVPPPTDTSHGTFNLPLSTHYTHNSRGNMAMMGSLN